MALTQTVEAVAVDLDLVGSLVEVQIVGAVVVVHMSVCRTGGPTELEGLLAWEGLAVLGFLVAMEEVPPPPHPPPLPPNKSVYADDISFTRRQSLKICNIFVFNMISSTGRRYVAYSAQDSA